MDEKNFKQEPPEALKREWADAQERLRNLEFKQASNQVKNVREIRLLKKTIARLQTFLRANTSK